MVLGKYNPQLICRVKNRQGLFAYFKVLVLKIPIGSSASEPKPAAAYSPPARTARD